jgi:hypothetical protein
MKSLAKASCMNTALQVIQHMNAGMTVVEAYSLFIRLFWLALESIRAPGLTSQLVQSLGAGHQYLLDYEPVQPD